VARVVTLRCDICKKPTEAIAGKLYYSTVTSGVRSLLSNYSHHADVGVCCADRLLRGFDFKKRITKEEYNSKRKNSKGKLIR